MCDCMDVYMEHMCAYLYCVYRYMMGHAYIYVCVYVYYVK